MTFKEDYIQEFEAAFGGPDVNVNGMKIKLWLKKHPVIDEYLKEIFSKEPRYKKFGNVIWAFRNRFDIDAHKCKMCGKPLELKSVFYISKYCSARCAKADPEINQKMKDTIAKDPDYYKKREEKIKKTCLERYGVEFPGMSEQVKAKAKVHWENDPDFWNRRNEKSKQVWLEHYGVENPSCADEVKQKKADTCMKHFGVDTPAKDPSIQAKIEQTCLDKYGVKCQFQRQDLIDKSNDISWAHIQQWKDVIIPMFTRAEYTGQSHGQEYKWKCVKCGHEFTSSIFSTKHLDEDQYIPRCEKCYPRTGIASIHELELLEFIRQYFPDASKDRKLIAPLELDIVIPEKKVAIEFNGDYWHSSEKHGKFYHLDKLLACKKQGWKLIHVNEYEWRHKKEIVKNRLLSILGIMKENTYARKCKVVELSSKEKNEFLNAYHLQGEDKSKVKLGLKLGDDLVAVMTFGKPRFNKSYEWEMIRYASKGRVVGGASKLLSYFIKTYSPKSIITYADRRWSSGNLYRQIGFKELASSGPGYVYIKGESVLGRMNCQKHQLKKILGNKFDEALTESENMRKNGWLQEYDCGNLVFEWKSNDA